MPIPLRDIRRQAGYEVRRQGASALADALEGSQWYRGARCRGCGFLERVPTGYKAVSAWRCVSGWHDCWSQRGWDWYQDAKKLYATILDKVRKEDWQYPRLEINPSSFACWLFRPGEALSAHYWRAGQWPEYLALRALAGP